jgi:hypothetical protein
MGNPIPATSVVPAAVHALQQAPAWTNKEAQLIAATIAPGLNANELRLFAKVCERSGKDPFRKEIYAWKSSGKLCLHIGISGWRSDAVATGEYLGQAGPEWCGEDGIWKDIWLAKAPPVAARVGVRRLGFPEPLYATCMYKEFKRPGPNWEERPAHMLGIRAEYHALMRAFPDAYKGTLDAIEEAGAELSVGEDEPAPALLSVDTETGEITEPVSPAAPEPTQPPEPDWTRFKTLLDEAALTMRDLTPVLGIAPSKANWKAEITEWLADGGGRDFDDLIRLALDELAGPLESEL